MAHLRSSKGAVNAVFALFLVTCVLAFAGPAAVSVNIDLTVAGCDQSPPDSSIITLVASDLARGASVSRSVTVHE